MFSLTLKVLSGLTVRAGSAPPAGRLVGPPLEPSKPGSPVGPGWPGTSEPQLYCPHLARAGVLGRHGKEGSTVRVRQRALCKSRRSRFLVQANLFLVERPVDASICGAAVAAALLQGRTRRDRLRRRHRGQQRRPPAGDQPHRRDRRSTAARQRPTWPGTSSSARPRCWRAASGSCRRSAATAPTRTPSYAAWARTGTVLKPYPCNHFTHAGVDAALRLGARARPADVTAIELGVAKPVLHTIAEPPEAKTTADLRVLRCVQRPLHGRRVPAPRRPGNQCPTRAWRGSSTTTPEIPPGGARGRARGPNARPS